jgi:2-polyprenyl-3-methyl-5-hydroxy-6-metoxy-1,4-benzoquinol methylase
MIETFPKDSPFLILDSRSDRWAIPYHYEALNSRVENLLIKNHAALRKRTVLDLGCHFGTFAYASLVHGATYVQGIDTESKLVRRAGELFRDHRVAPERYGFSEDPIVPYLERLQPESYDTILCLGVLYYLADLFHALSLMKRAARRHIILDTFTARFGACMSREGETISRSVIDDTFDLPIVLHPQTQSEKRDYTIPVHFLTRRKKRVSLLSLPTERALEYFFQLLDLGYRKISWDGYVVNHRSWKDFMDIRVKQESHWADVYHAGIRVSYLLEK